MSVRQRAIREQEEPSDLVELAESDPQKTVIADLFRAGLAHLAGTWNVSVVMTDERGRHSIEPSRPPMIPSSANQ